MKKIILFTIYLLILFAFSRSVYAEEHLPVCEGDTNLVSCQEFQNAVGLSWNALAPGRLIQYSVEWLIATAGVTSCPLNYPPLICGSTSTTQNTALITGLYQGARYKFTVRPVDSNSCSITLAQQAGNSISCTPTVCQDGYKGTSEICDDTSGGVDLGGATCVQKGFEGGTLSCTNKCQLDTSQCISCNKLKSVQFSNGINNLAVAAAGATVNCSVEAERAGQYVSCRVLGPDKTVLSYCNFVGWSNNRADFRCAAPDNISTSFYLEALYPQDDPSKPSSGGSGIPPGCSRQTLLENAPSGRPIAVLKPETDSPKVNITEDYGTNYFYENPSQLKIGVLCEDSSNCDGSSYKFKRFDSRPASCPQNYTDYDLSVPYQPDLSRPAFFCAAAKDVLGITGFSQAVQVNPGCRNQCPAVDDLKCEFTGGKSASIQKCGNFDADACFEWAFSQSCLANSCLGGICKSSSKANFGDGYVWHDKNGDGQRVGEDGIGGVRVQYTVGSGANEEGNVVASYSDGYFPMTTIKANTNPTIYIPPVLQPAGWKLTKTVCKVTRLKCIEPSADDCNNYAPCDQDRVVEDLSEGSNCVLPWLNFSDYTPNAGFCSSPEVAFGFTKTDTTAPTISLTVPQTADPTQKVTIDTNVKDETGIHKVEIFVNESLVKKCEFELAENPPKETSCSFTGGPYPLGSYQVYAKVWDNTDNLTTSPIQTLNVNAPPPPVGGGGAGGGSTVTTCGVKDLKLLEGLLTSPPNQGQTVSQGPADSSTKCIIDPKAAFAPFKIPSFEDLKSLYYTQK